MKILSLFLMIFSCQVLAVDWGTHISCQGKNSDGQDWSLLFSLPAAIPDPITHIIDGATLTMTGQGQSSIAPAFITSSAHDSNFDILDVEAASGYVCQLSNDQQDVLTARCTILLGNGKFDYYTCERK